MTILTEFLLARIAEDYETERADSPLGSARETAARVRANVRMMTIFGAMSVAGERVVGAAYVEAVKYADHPDYDENWRP